MKKAMTRMMLIASVALMVCCSAEDPFGDYTNNWGVEELYLIDYKEKAAGRKLDDLEVKDRIFTSENYSMNAANYREKWQIQDDLKPYVSRKKDLEYNFSKIKDTLLKMRSDSALCK